jgi:redox-sensitive bicupin YhaK (pirin superfamily)
MHHLRNKGDIELVECSGYRYRRYLGALGARAGSLDPRELGFGALRVFDEVVIDAGSRLRVEAHDGLEAVVYVLEGECAIEDERGQVSELPRDSAACVRLGEGTRYDVYNRSSTTLGVFVAAIAAPLANPCPGLALARFARDVAGIVWVGSPAAGEHHQGSLLLGLSVRVGIATLEPGVEIRFPSALNRGLYAAVLEGYIEFDNGFVDAGGDARASLASPGRIQGVTRARVVIADVAMEFVQQLD